MTDYSPNIRKLLAISLWGFVLIALVLGYWQIVMAPTLNASKYNQRQRLALQRIKPGRVYTKDGVVILAPQRQEGQWKFTYPAGSDFAHLTGYAPQTGLQYGLREPLYGLGQYADAWRDLLAGGPTGNDIVLTINSAAQKLAVEELDGRRGAVVALNPRTGATLVLASAPTYDPAEVSSSQEELNLFRFDPNVPELNRAVQGLYPPGSVFKIFTVAVGLDLGLATPETEFRCAGTERVAHTRVKCRILSGHGALDLDRALCDSCNIAFAKLGEKIGIDNFIAYMKKFHLLDEANVGLPSKKGRMYDFRGFKGDAQLALASFGQGATMLTPFEVARLTAAIANGGHVLQPYIVAQVMTPDKRVRTKGEAGDFGQAIKPETAHTLAGMMQNVVEKGTGRVAALSGISVAGKTGSAENPQGPAHGWFTCFAPVENPQVVVTVVVEGGESGSESAGPIARKVLEELLETQNR